MAIIDLTLTQASFLAAMKIISRIIGTAKGVSSRLESHNKNHITGANTLRSALGIKS
jgi:hypothetical protein